MSTVKIIQDRILLKRCRLDGGTQPRAEMSLELIDDISHADPDDVEHIDTVFDGTWYWVWNGHHRVTGLRRGKQKEVRANIRRGTRLDAVILSLSANAGQKTLRRTNADMHRAVETVFLDENLAALFTTNVAIADVCAVSEGFVRKVRKELFPAKQRNKGHAGSSYNTTPSPVPEVPEEFLAVYDALTDEQKAAFARKKDDELVKVQARTDAKGWLKGVEKDIKRLRGRFKGKPDVTASDRKHVEDWLEKIGAVARKYEAA